MKLIFISDTHSLHDWMLTLGSGDVLATIQRINACILDERYRVRNLPVEVEL